MSSKLLRENSTASQEASTGFLKFFITAVIVVGVVFSDIIYYQIIGIMFPPGLMQGIGILGALTTAASVILLYWGKQTLFRPGHQVIFAWIFTAIEVVTMIMNDILYFSLQSGGHINDQFMGIWKIICPAAPVISVLGWLILVFLDPARGLLHKRMEKQDRLAKAEVDMYAEMEQSEIDFKLSMHRMRMEAKYKAAEDMQRHLAQTIAYEVQEDLQLGASDMGRDIASSLTNTPLSRLSQPKKTRIVDADVSRPAVAASKEQILDPYKVKPTIDNEKKPLERKSLAEKLRGMVDFSLPDTVQDDKPILEESGDTTRTRRIGGDPDLEAQEDLEDEWKPGDPLPDNYLDWSESQWKQAKNQLDAFTYQQIFDETFPDEKPVTIITPAKKKATGGKQPKKALQKTGKRGG